MIHIRTALYELLSEDTPLEELVGSRIYFQEAPSSASYPLVIFHEQADTARHTMEGPPAENKVWTVKGVDTDPDVTEAIADAIEEILTDATLEIEGSDTLDVRWVSAVNYPESTEGGGTYRHLGAMWRIWVA